MDRRLDMFDPWMATFEEAKAEQDRWLSSGNDLNSPVAPFYQYCAACAITDLKKAIEGGDGFSVLEAVSLCLWRGLVAPNWLAKAFLVRYRTVVNCNADSWDDPSVFGKPYPKGKHLAALKKRRFLSPFVAHKVAEIRAKDPENRRPIDKGLFEEVGDHFGIKATLTEDLYYKHVSYWGNPLDDLVDWNTVKKRKSAGLQKKRK